MTNREMLKEVERLEKMTKRRPAKAPLEPIHEWLAANGFNEPAPEPDETMESWVKKVSKDSLSAMIEAHREEDHASAHRQVDGC